MQPRARVFQALFTLLMDARVVVSGAHQLKVKKPIVRWERGWLALLLRNLTLGLFFIPHLLNFVLFSGIAKIAISSLIDTLQENDYFNVITINTEVKYIVPCIKYLIQATKENKEMMKR